MKTNQIFTVIFALVCIFILTSYKNKSIKQTEETIYNHKIVREYFDGKTFYILVDHNGNAINFIEKK